MLSFPVSPSVLRATVWFDAYTGVLLGAAHLLLTAQLADGLGLPASLLMGTGVALLGYAALAIRIASARSMPATFSGSAGQSCVIGRASNRRTFSSANRRRRISAVLPLKRLSR